MFYPTGDSPNGKLLICIDDAKPEIDEVTADCNEACMLECLSEWLEENNCCVENWQLKEYLKDRGINESRIEEDMAAGAAAGAPAAGLATLGTVSGMGNPQAPRNGGTNAGFYNDSLNGSGDKFPSLTVGTGAAKGTKGKGKVVSSYLDFLKKKKK